MCLLSLLVYRFLFEFAPSWRRTPLGTLTKKARRTWNGRWRVCYASGNARWRKTSRRAWVVGLDRQNGFCMSVLCAHRRLSGHGPTSGTGSVCVCVYLAGFVPHGDDLRTARIAGPPGGPIFCVFLLSVLCRWFVTSFPFSFCCCCCCCCLVLDTSTL